MSENVGVWRRPTDNAGGPDNAGDNGSDNEGTEQDTGNEAPADTNAQTEHGDEPTEAITTDGGGAQQAGKTDTTEIKSADETTSSSGPVSPSSFRC